MGMPEGTTDLSPPTSLEFDAPPITNAQGGMQLSPAQLEMMIQEQVQERVQNEIKRQVQMELERMTAQLLPDMAEKLLKQEIHKMLLNPPSG